MSFARKSKGCEVATIMQLLSIMGAIEDRQLRKLFSHLSDQQFGQVIYHLQRNGAICRSRDGRYIAMNRMALERTDKAYHVMRPIVIATMGLIFSYHTQKYMVNSLAKVDDIIWGTANKPAQFLQRFNSNVLVLFQRVQRFISHDQPYLLQVLRYPSVLLPSGSRKPFHWLVALLHLLKNPFQAGRTAQPDLDHRPKALLQMECHRRRCPASIQDCVVQS